ncbi:30S ribosomal protein S18 [bacterium]|nr:30S ribosomal protein S18 [bacterium]
MSNKSGSRGGRRGGSRRYFSRPRSCQFCSDPEVKIHYRNTQLLSNFVNREGKIRPRRQTGTCAKHQRKVAVAVKRARHMALLQFSGESLN